MSLKKSKLLLCSVLLLASSSVAQDTWSGSSTSTFTNGKVGVGYANPDSKLGINSYSNGVSFTPAMKIVHISQDLGNSLNDHQGDVVSVYNHHSGSLDLQRPPHKLFSIDLKKTVVHNRLQVGKRAPSSVYGDYTLGVDGTVVAKKCIIQIDHWADYVFDDNYQLKPLEEVEEYINLNKHLPEMPTKGEVLQNGMDVSEVQVLLLKKIEELTLYMIELKKENERLKKEVWKK